MDYNERINLLLDMVATRDARIMKLSRYVDDIGDHNTTLRVMVDVSDAKISEMREEIKYTVDMNITLRSKLGTALADLRKINQNTFAENYARLERQLEAQHKESDDLVRGRNIALWRKHQLIRDAMASLQHLLEE
jgi:hypothetical protein